MENYICKGCNAKVDKPVLCTSFGIASHPGCLQRSEHLHANGTFINCVPKSSGLQPSISREDLLIKRSQQILSAELQKFENKLLAEISSMRTDLTAISNRATVLEEKVSTLTSSSAHSLEIDEDVFAELAERDRRSTNLILFNLEEPPESSSIKDNELAFEILQQIIPYASSVCRTTRIGKITSGRIRPLRVSLPSRKDVLNVVQHQRNYTGPGKIDEDRTLKQRTHLRKLKEQRKALHQAGNCDKTLRFVNGIPRIVTSNQTRSKKN